MMSARGLWNVRNNLFQQFDKAWYEVTMVTEIVRDLLQHAHTVYCGGFLTM